MSSEIIPVRVALRIRPISNKEVDNGCDTALDKIANRPQVLIRNSEKAFTYDYAFTNESSQEEVYEKSVLPIINQIFKGYNGTVLAYGQTGSGKTYSMGTSNKEHNTPLDLEGVIPRAIRDIFSRIKKLKNDYEFCVRVSFVELYKEKLYDLLSSKSKIKDDCQVDLREDPVKGVMIANLTEVVVEDLRSTMEQLERGSVKRVTASTAMNNTSSRSHAIFTIYLEGSKKSKDETKLDNIMSKFHLVDLAGSERAKKTMTTGVRYKEGVAINLGLLALGNVISALGDDCGPKTFIPYRDSKLTRLLQDSLGGNSHTLMIACVSPADTNLEETLSTLRYADRARKIKNKPIVNQDSKDAENAKLKREIACLKLQMMDTVGSNEIDEIKSENKQLKSELKEVTAALLACQDELSHLNEKMVINEEHHGKLKTKIDDLANETEILMRGNPTKSDLGRIVRKIRNVRDVQKDNEKSLVEHDLSRFDSTSSTSVYEDAVDELEDASKHSELASQLASLNKQLAQKEQYASVLLQQEDELKEIKQKYEGQLKKMESRIRSIEVEKTQLTQLAKSDPMTSRISEQRRKRIQELEAELYDLKKKINEQQRMIKMNEKNEKKSKTLCEEIKAMKQAKVRLIRQMKDEAEKNRKLNIQRDKEVNQLKQIERKQQAQMTKMANLHSKQQTVLRRKMEDAMAANKRLKEVIEKQKASQRQSALGTKGLNGALERMKNIVSQELDVVVSVMEAKNSREQLLTDRKTLTKELNDLKKKQRTTMTTTERQEMQLKMNDLQDQLDMQNAQISELQKQIMDAQDDNTIPGLNGKWWDYLSSMTEAKIALQYLFEKAAESMAGLSSCQANIKELKSIYDEAMKNTQALEDEINTLKDEHEEKMLEAGKDYEDRVSFLLKQITGKKNDVCNEVMKESDIQKFSQLQETLLKMTQEFEARKAKPMHALLNKLDQSFNEDDQDEIFDEDSGWYQTPLIKRIQKIRETALKSNTKRTLGETFTERKSSGSKRRSKSPLQFNRRKSPRLSVTPSDSSASTLSLLNETYDVPNSEDQSLSKENKSTNSEEGLLFKSPYTASPQKKRTVLFSSPLRK